MHRSPTHPAYSFAPPTNSRYSSTAHSTSSAMSPSANPDEDWTKISDLAERRRIQNRIAQRNYRKKLKRRLEDLERRAGSSSASPEQPHAILASAPAARPKETEAARKRRSKIESPPQRSQKSPTGPAQHNPLSRDDMFARQHTRQLSTSPPAFTYGYAGPEQHSMHPSYPQHAAYHNLPTPYSDHSSQPLYLPPLPVSLPSMSLYDGGSVKQESSYADEMLGPYNMGYSAVGNMDVPTSQSYSDPNAYVNNPEYSFQVL